MFIWVLLEIVEDFLLKYICCLILMMNFFFEFGVMFVNLFVGVLVIFGDVRLLVVL